MEQREGYRSFFNYDLNCQTWRLLVNKQISMTYQRLVIEYQLAQIQKREKDERAELETLNSELREVRYQKSKLQKSLGKRGYY